MINSRQRLIDLQWAQVRRCFEDFEKAKRHAERIRLVKALNQHVRVLAKLLTESDDAADVQRSLRGLLRKIPKKYRVILHEETLVT